MKTTKKKTQLDRIKEAARELWTDDDEARFNEKLRKLAKQRPNDKKQSDDSPGLSRRSAIAQKGGFVKHTITLVLPLPAPCDLTMDLATKISASS